MMTAFFVAAPLIFALLFILVQTRHMPERCPECEFPLSRFQSPFTKTKRQWRHGGFQCTRCACELDLNGVVVGRADASQRLSVLAVASLITVPVVCALVLPLVMFAVMNR